MRGTNGYRILDYVHSSCLFAAKSPALFIDHWVGVNPVCRNCPYRNACTCEIKDKIKESPDGITNTKS